MKIEKQCKNEIIQYESIDKYKVKKTYLTKDKIIKKSKEINFDCGEVKKIYNKCFNSKSFMDYLIIRKNYILVNEELSN